MLVDKKLISGLPCFQRTGCGKRNRSYCRSAGGLTADVRRDDHLRHVPQLARRRQRLGLGDVHPAPARRPLSKAATRSLSTTSGPRATLTRHASGFIFASTAASIMPRVSWSAAPQRIRKSTSGSRSSSRSAGQSDSTQSGLSMGNRSTARIRVSNALSVRASRRPTPPKPTMPTVLRVRSRVGRRMNSLTCWARKNVGRLRSRRSSGRSCARPPGRPGARSAGDERSPTRPPTAPGNGPCRPPTTGSIATGPGGRRRPNRWAPWHGRKRRRRKKSPPRSAPATASTISASGATAAICFKWSGLVR